MDLEFQTREELSKFDGLNDIDRLVILEKLKNPNITLEALSEKTKMSVPGLSYRMTRSAFKSAYLNLMGSTDQLLKEAAIRAAHKLNKLIESRNEKVSLESVKFALQNKIAQKIEVEQNKKIIFETNVGYDGSLIQQMTTELLGEPKNG